MFPVATGAGGFKFLLVFLFLSSLLALGFPKYSSSVKRRSVSCSSFCYIPMLLYQSPVGVVVNCGGRRAFYGLI